MALRMFCPSSLLLFVLILPESGAFGNQVTIVKGVQSPKNNLSYHSGV